MTTVEVDIVNKSQPPSEDANYVRIWRKGCQDPGVVVTFNVRFGAKQAHVYANNDEHAVESECFTGVDVFVEESKRCVDKTTGHPCTVPNSKTKVPFRIDLQKRNLDGTAGGKAPRKKTRSDATGAVRLRLALSRFLLSQVL